MLRKYVSLVLVLAAFLLLPLVAHASPVTLSGGSVISDTPQPGGTQAMAIISQLFGASSDTTVMTKFNLSAIFVTNSTPTYNSIISTSPNFELPVY